MCDEKTDLGSMLVGRGGGTPSMRKGCDGGKKKWGEKKEKRLMNIVATTSLPSGEGGTRSPHATPHRQQNPKWPPGGPKMADGVWKGV